MPVKTVPSVIIGSGSNKSIVNNIYNNDFGNTIITGYLTVDYYLTVDGNLTVGGSFDLAGSFELSGDITVKNPSDETVFSVDSATGDTLTKGDIEVKNPSDATVFSVDSATGDTLTKGDITVKNPSDVTVFSVDSATGDTLTKGDITVKNPSDVTVFSVDSATGDTIVEGNLTINGTTTTIDSVTLVVEDPVITLAKNANSNPTASTDAGLFLQRGSTENPAIFIWNETLNQFEVSTVTGATSATTNFTGGGVTKTFASFKGGDLYGSTLDITGFGAFGNINTGSLAITEHSFDINGISLGEYGNLNIHSDQTYSSIVLNANITSGDPTTNATIEVKRGSSTSSKITWDENGDRWDFNFGLYLNTDSQIKIEKFTTPATTPAILLNSDYTGNPDVDGSDVKAIEVERGVLTNSYIQWDETNDRWKAEPSFYSTAIEGGDLYGSTLDITGFGAFGNISTGLLTITEHNFDMNGISLGEYGNLNIHSDQTYSSIVLNANVTSGDPTTNATIEVKRGSSPDSYIEWDENGDYWNISPSLYVSGSFTSEGNVTFTGDGDLTVNSLNPTFANQVNIKVQDGVSSLLLNSDVTGVPNLNAKIEVERGDETNSYIEWDEAGVVWDISPKLRVLDSSGSARLELDNSSIITYNPLRLNHSLFYRTQIINNASTNIDSDVTFVVIENGSSGSTTFQPSLPDISTGGMVIHIAIRGSDSIELYPANVNQYIQHDSIQYSIGSPLTLRGKSSIQLISYVGGGGVKDWHVTAINGEHTFNSKVVLGESDLTLTGLVPLFGSPVASGDGYITATKGYHKIATTLALINSILTTVDTLIQINGGVTGMILILQAQDNGTLSIEEKLTPGNIKLSTSPFTLDSSYDTITLIYNGEYWCEISRSNNA